MERAQKKLILISVLAMASSLIAFAAAYHFHAQYRVEKQQASQQK